MDYEQALLDLDDDLDNGDVDFDDYIKQRDTIIAKRATERYHDSLVAAGVFDKKVNDNTAISAPMPKPFSGMATEKDSQLSHKILSTVATFFVGGVVFGIVRDIIGHGQYIIAGVMVFILIKIWFNK